MVRGARPGHGIKIVANMLVIPPHPRSALPGNSRETLYTVCRCLHTGWGEATFGGKLCVWSLQDSVQSAQELRQVLSDAVVHVSKLVEGLLSSGCTGSFFPGKMETAVKQLIAAGEAVGGTAGPKKRAEPSFHGTEARRHSTGSR